MLAYRHNAPSIYTPRVAVIDCGPPPVLNNRYNWDAALARAERGVIPPAPRFSDGTTGIYLVTLDRIVDAAHDGDIRGLKEMKLKTYNHRWQALGRYRDLCVKALLRSKFKTL